MARAALERWLYPTSEVTLWVPHIFSIPGAHPGAENAGYVTTTTASGSPRAGTPTGSTSTVETYPACCTCRRRQSRYGIGSLGADFGTGLPASWLFVASARWAGTSCCMRRR